MSTLHPPHQPQHSSHLLKTHPLVTIHVIIVIAVITVRLNVLHIPPQHVRHCGLLTESCESA
ncbi:hypothetical protein EJ02DRAFT_454046 [Clathrospora elynae]|uniref:Uncharacterized protein n=1 Tax=Clathrospora elynae TaxID=706981 RepID=A0A6A5SSN7_9PLEO|nr:hypothetical protein EJ02DRAFT_454046 [Clathrospora elynae]